MHCCFDTTSAALSFPHGHAHRVEGLLVPPHLLQSWSVDRRVAALRPSAAGLSDHQWRQPQVPQHGFLQLPGLLRNKSMRRASHNTTVLTHISQSQCTDAVEEALRTYGTGACSVRSELGSLEVHRKVRRTRILIVVSDA